MRKHEVVYTMYKGILRPAIVRERKMDKVKLEVFYDRNFHVGDLMYFNWFDVTEIIHNS